MLLNLFLCNKFNHIKCAFSTVKQSLSYEQATTALRPFFFSVHPDFFSKFPKEKSVNENSLKILNGYLNSIYQGQATKPLQIGFYMRNTLGKTLDKSTLRFVRIRLEERNFVSLVKTILYSCNLSQDQIDAFSDIKSHPSPSTAQQSKWFNEYAEWDNFLKKFSSERFKSSSSSSHATAGGSRILPCEAIEWLKMNSKQARKQHIQNLPVEKDIQSITSELCGMFNIPDIVWTSDWNPISRRGCLASLHRFLLNTNNDRKFLQSILDSHRILITSRGKSGLSILNEIVLNSVEVPATWYYSLKTISNSSRHILNHKVPSQERALSILLGGVEVTRLPEFHQSLLADAYLTQLLFLNKRLAGNIQRQGGSHPGHQYVHDKNFKKLLVALDDTGDVPRVSPQGHFLIPPRCLAFLIYDHMSYASTIAATNSANYEQVSQQLLELKSQCIYQLGLRHIYFESNISAQQAVFCLQSIMEALNSTPIPNELADLAIKISQFYSVTSEGILTIPWNWSNL